MIVVLTTDELNVRWPSVRPDNIVTNEDFLKVRDEFAEEPLNIAINLTKRTRWDDGLDRGPAPGDGKNIRHVRFDFTLC